MDKKTLNERIQRLEADWRKERDQLIGRATDLEVEIKVVLSSCLFLRRLFSIATILNCKSSFTAGGKKKERPSGKGIRRRNAGKG